MIELPGISLDLLRAVLTNFTIIATLVLLYSFIPDTRDFRSRLAFPLCTGVIFGLAAALSIPSLWETTNAAALGVNIILVPLAGFIAGPVAAGFVAGVLLLGSVSSGGALSLPDLLTVMLGILLGSVFYFAKTQKWFVRSTLARLVLLGAGIVLIEAGVMAFLTPQQGPGSPAAFWDVFPLVSIIPFLIVSWTGTILIGFIIGFIDQKKQADRELLTYKDHLEGLVKERTAELAKASALQKATIESTADGIVVVDREGRIRAYNQKASRILDLPAQPWKEVQEPGIFVQIASALLADPGMLPPLVERLPESAEQVVTTNLLFGNGRVYELYVHPQYIGTYNAGRVWSLHDMTAQRMAEEAITAANNKLLLLSTLTRHDIFNQLTAIFAYLDLIRESESNPASAGHLDTMRKGLEVIQFQLEFTRDYQDLGLKKPAWQSVDYAFSQAAGAFQDRKVTFSCNTGAVEILADPMVGRVFYNLIDNSLRHGGRVSAIRLSARPEGPDLLLLYEDDGVGIPPEEKIKIFDRGFGKHTGLGMFLIREILAITGITVRETGIAGQGVRFEILVHAGTFRQTS